MNPMIQIKTSHKTAESAIQHLESMGYKAIRVKDERGATDVHFVVNGETSISHSITFVKRFAYVGFRPKYIG